MTDVTEPDRLAARVLREIDRAAEAEPPSSDRHPDEETLALFALGDLRGPSAMSWSAISPGVRRAARPRAPS